MLKDQTSYLNKVTELTEKEAEAYILRYTSPDSTTNSELSSKMGIDNSTFSQHLKKANEKVNGNPNPRSVNDKIEDSTINPILELLTMSDVGGSDNILRKPVKIDETPNYTLIVLKRIAGESESFAGEYKVVLVSKISPIENIDYDEMPDDVVLGSVWNIYTFEADTIEKLETVSEYYTSELEMDDSDKFLISKYISDIPTN